MESLSKDASEVKTILVVIEDIENQTNLLALNTAIKAGEHGRSCFANKVRKLAERTQKSLAEINTTINIIVQSITLATSKMIVTKIEEVDTISSENARSVEEIVAAADH